MFVLITHIPCLIVHGRVWSQGDKLNIKQLRFRYMQQKSLQAFSKISWQMNKLSDLMSQDQLIRHELQQAVLHPSPSLSSSEDQQNLDIYFKQYDNPTTKSLPYQEEQLQVLQDEETQTVNTIYRKRPFEESFQGERDQFHDDKSTVIMPALKQTYTRQGQNIQGQKREYKHFTQQQAKQQKHRNQHQIYPNPKEKQGSKAKMKKKKQTGTNSMPPEVYSSVDLKNKHNNSKHQLKGQSPSFKIQRQEEDNHSHNNNSSINHNSRVTEQKGGVSKMSRIDKEQLVKLQEKKAQKKTQLSSNRRKTKRQLQQAKSATNIMQKTGSSINYKAGNSVGYKTGSSVNYKAGNSVNYKGGNTVNYKTLGAYQKTHNKPLSTNKPHYSSSKGIEQKQPQIVDMKQQLGEQQKHVGKDRDQKQQEWQRTTDKAVRKLNRVNICKLQENIKKTQEKKIKKEGQSKTYEKCQLKQSPKRNHGFKLHFTEQQEQTQMHRLIQAKDLGKQYQRATNKYLQASLLMDCRYFKQLIKQCRETSEQAIFKLKLVMLLVYFFDQFSPQPILAHLQAAHNIFEVITQQEIIQILLHPSRLKNIIDHLPNILLTGNVISAQRTVLFGLKLGEINQQLDQQLQYFLLKKTPLYSIIHCLYEYITFLVEKQLVRQTKRSKVVEKQPSRKMEGFYSNRSKKEEKVQRYLKKKEGNCRMGLRCDSDRKITFEEEELVVGLRTGKARAETLVKGASKKLLK